MAGSWRLPHVDIANVSRLLLRDTVACLACLLGSRHLPHVNVDVANVGRLLLRFTGACLECLLCN